MSDLPPERWLTVIGWEDLYEVSDLGRVRSLDRWLRNSRDSGYNLRRGKILRLRTDTRGRHSIALRYHHRQHEIYVGRLVLEAFVGPCPEGMECCHGPARNPDGSQCDRLDNIRWDTRQANNGPDKLRDGTLLRGERNGFAKLTEADVSEIRALYESTRHLPLHHPDRWTLEMLAERHSCSLSRVSRVVRRESWTHLT